VRVFVTGAAGLLGAHLAEAFIAAGADVVGCDNLIGGDVDNLPEGIEFEPADCCDLSAMKRLTAGCDVVYHCAAIAPEGYSVFAPALLAQHVYQNTATVLAAAANERARRFVFCSSMARYGTGNPPFTEDQPVAPETPYSIAKVAAEMLVRNLAEIHGFEHVIAVPHNIIGPKQKYDDPYRNVAAIMINRMLQGHQPIIYGDGEQQRSFSFVEDCVDPLVKMAELPGLDGEVVNIGPDDEPITINELARMIAGMLAFNLDPVYLPERIREVRVATCSSDKARRLLGYRTTVTLREGLSSMIDWIRAHGVKPFIHHLPLEIDSAAGPPTWREGAEIAVTLPTATA
jgi:UDP-glucose 4-epimerase